jgi:hypothetical protein
MRPCIVGIGGAGGNILRQFLQSQDVNLMVQLGEHLAFGDVKGVWLDSASQDAQRQRFYGGLEQRYYPGYLICHDIIDPSSPTRSYVMERYGLDLKAQGYDRRAEYLKGIFEIFDCDSELADIASREFGGERSPLPSYIWRRGIRPFTTISKRAGRNDGFEIAEAVGARSSSQNQLMDALDSVAESLRGDKGGQPAKLCDSILFIASLGGGTGTGFINPITSYVRSEELAFPILAMGVLTEKGTEARHASEGQRDLGAVIALYDLLTKEPGTGIDGLIVVDNQVLVDRYQKNFPAIDKAIYRAMRPLLDLRSYPGEELQDDAPAMRRVFWEADSSNGSPQRQRPLPSGEDEEELVIENEIQQRKERTILLPPLLVPCYHCRRGTSGQADFLVDKALARKSRLFPCQPSRAERAYVFARGFFRSQDLLEAVSARTGLSPDKVKVYRKIGDGRSEDMLILLRNPYGGSPGSHKDKETLEGRVHEVMDQALRYMEDDRENILGYLGYCDFTKEHLRSYFYGEGGLQEELQASLKRLEQGKKPIFSRPLTIFKGETVAAPAEEKVALEEGRLRDLVKNELKEMLKSEECRSKIREMISSS